MRGQRTAPEIWANRRARGLRDSEVSGGSWNDGCLVTFLADFNLDILDFHLATLKQALSRSLAYRAAQVLDSNQGARTPAVRALNYHWQLLNEKLRTFQQRSARGHIMAEKQRFLNDSGKHANPQPDYGYSGCSRGLSRLSGSFHHILDNRKLMHRLARLRAAA